VALANLSNITLLSKDKADKDEAYKIETKKIKS